MPDAAYIRIPLRRRDGTIKAHAIIDVEDAHLAVHRWHLSGGYAKRSLHHAGGRQQTVWLHRAILGLTPGDGVEVDHIDGNGLNCRRENLRVATHAQNVQNVPSHAGSSSRYRGVSWNSRRGKWKAQAQLNGVVHTLGRFDDEQEAAAVVQAWRLAHMPFTVEARAAASDATGLPL